MFVFMNSQRKGAAIGGRPLVWVVGGRERREVDMTSSEHSNVGIIFVRPQDQPSFRMLLKILCSCYPDYHQHRVAVTTKLSAKTKISLCNLDFNHEIKTHHLENLQYQR